MSASHVPVLLERVVALIAPALQSPGAVLVDATVGMGGHTAAILDRCPEARVVGLDRDRDALTLTEERLSGAAERLTLVHAVYDQIPRVLAGLGISRVQGVLFDLGVSSMQLDVERRGFSYAHDGPLDMRMDQGQATTAAEILNTYDVPALALVLSRYGEERYARRIALGVARERARRPIDSSARLVDIVRDAIPAAARRRGGNPAKRTFQALRIEVNDELALLERALPAAVDALAVGGRVVVLSYQSLEDRTVKRFLRSRATSALPVDLPVLPAGHEPQLRLLTRGAERADEAEVQTNPRAASVRMRAAERIREAA